MKAALIINALQAMRQAELVLLRTTADSQERGQAWNRLMCARVDLQLALGEFELNLEKEAQS